MRSGWLLVVPLVVIAGCAGEVGGEPVAADSTAPAVAATTTELPAELSGADVLGDLATLQWCDLGTTTPLAQFGLAAPEDSGEFDACTYIVEAEDGAVLTVYIASSSPSFVRTGEFIDERDAGHGLRVLTTNVDETSCNQHIEFADKVAFQIGTLLDAGEFPIEDCGPTEAISEHVVDRFLSGKRPNHVPMAERSLRELDACALGGPAVATVREYAKVKPMPVGPHACWWDLPDPYTGVRVKFGMTHQSRRDGEISTIAGRETAIYRYPDNPSLLSCFVEGRHISLTGGVANRFETATVYAVSDQRSMEEICATATTVAEALFPKLPPVA